MALIEVRVPQLSESVAEATLLQWHRKTGEAVARDENLIDIETDKVVLELPAPDSGVITQILKPDGSTVTAGEIIAILDTEAKAGAVAAPAAAPAAVAAAPAASVASATSWAAPVAQAVQIPAPPAASAASTCRSTTSCTKTHTASKPTARGVISAVSRGAKNASSCGPPAKEGCRNSWSYDLLLNTAILMAFLRGPSSDPP